MTLDDRQNALQRSQTDALEATTIVPVSTDAKEAQNIPKAPLDWMPTETTNVRSTDNYGEGFVSERSIGEPRPLKLVYIGAGISGIIAAIEFLRRIPHLELVIYEKNPEVGGTWFENRYPGCACDVPSHSYQLSFESWVKWDKFFAGAPEILEYWKRIATKYDVRKRVRFEQKCIGARWSEASSKWIVQLNDIKTGLNYQDTADVLMTGEGILNEWKWPDIKGLPAFKGTLLHSANWDVGFEAKDKSIAVIGAGSSGIQIVPALEPIVKSMDHYVRGRTWISHGHGKAEIMKRTEGKGGNFSYTDEEKALWESNRDAYLEYRRSLEYQIQTRIGITYKNSPQQVEARATFRADMEKRLQNKPDIIKHLIPEFPPLCKRLTPGPGYLEALTSPKVNVIATAISHIDETGIVTNDGVHHPVDAIVCATGFQTSPGARGFPIYGRNGTNLRERYQHSPDTYLGLCTNEFPNFFQSLGPNSFQGAGNLLAMIESIHGYVGQILEGMVYDNIGIVEPKKESVQAFSSHCQRYFERTVYVEECDSWYKSSKPGATREEMRRGRVTALWPGSSLHAKKALDRVRWVDFDTKAYDGNTFGWFGNGLTVAEKCPSAENIHSFSWYLDDTNILKDVEYESRT